MFEKLLKPKEVAKKLNIGLRSVYRLIEGRRITFVKLGLGKKNKSCIRFRMQDVQEFVNNNVVEKLECKNKHTS